MRRLSVLLLGATFVLTACSDDDLTNPPYTSSAPSAESSYAVMTDDAWTLHEAIDPPADAPIASIERPPLKWYAEYVQSSTRESAMVRLSGHHATFADTRAVVEALGFAFDNDLLLQHWQGAGGSAPADPASPTIIVLANGTTCPMALSYELGLDQLTAIADTIEGVDQATWIAAGEVIQ